MATKLQISEFLKCVQKIEKLSTESWAKLKNNLLESNKIIFEKFFLALRTKLDRIIEHVIIVALFGNSHTLGSIGEAIKFIDDFDVKTSVGDFKKYELIVVYSNGDEIKGMFSSKKRAKDFLGYVS